MLAGDGCSPQQKVARLRVVAVLAIVAPHQRNADEDEKQDRRRENTESSQELLLELSLPLCGRAEVELEDGMREPLDPFLAPAPTAAPCPCRVGRSERAWDGESPSCTKRPCVVEQHDQRHEHLGCADDGGYDEVCAVAASRSCRARAHTARHQSPPIRSSRRWVRAVGAWRRWVQSG